MAGPSEETPTTEPQQSSHDDVYDRQIRLWGAEAQNRMSNARVLYVHATGVSCEIIKNLVLAGVAATVCDGRPHPDAMEGVPNSFFGSEGGSTSEEEDVLAPEPQAKKPKLESEPEAKMEAGSNENKSTSTVAAAIQPLVQELNPLIECTAEERSLEDIEDDYFLQFDAIVASKLSLTRACRIARVLADAALRPDDEGTYKSRLFVIADTFGLDGCAFLDFSPHHTFRRELGKDKLSDIMSLDPYVPMKFMLESKLTEARGRWDKSPPRILLLHRLLMGYREDVSPTPRNNVNVDNFVHFCENWIKSNNLSENCLSSSLSPKDCRQAYRQVAHISNAEIAPVCAVLGGILGNEIIKSLTGKGEPANNVLLFDGMEGGCRNFLLGKSK